MAEKISAALMSAEDSSGNRDKIYLETSTDEIITHGDSDDEKEPITFTEEVIKLRDEDSKVRSEANSTKSSVTRSITSESNARANADSKLRTSATKILNESNNYKNTSDDLFVVGESTPTGNKYKKMWMKPAELETDDRPHQPWEEGTYTKDPSLPEYTLSGGPTVGPTGVVTPQPELESDENE